MDAHLLLFAKTALSTLHVIMNGEGYLANGFLHLVHTDIAVEIAEDIVERTLLWNIASNVLLLNHHGIGSPTDERGKDILSSLDGYMSITKGLVLRLQLILEETLQLMLGFWSVGCNTIFRTQLHLTHVAQLLITGGRQTEGVLKTILGSRIGYEEIVKSLGQTSHDDNRILIPLVHLDEQLIERVHLVRIAIRQQFLNIIKEQDSILCLLDIVIPLIDKTLIVYSINHRQLGLLNNLMLVEIISYDFRQSSFTGTCFTYYNSINTQADLHDIPARVEIGISIDHCL